MSVFLIYQLYYLSYLFTWGIRNGGKESGVEGGLVKWSGMRTGSESTLCDVMYLSIYIWPNCE